MFPLMFAILVRTRSFFVVCLFVYTLAECCHLCFITTIIIACQVLTLKLTFLFCVRVPSSSSESCFFFVFFFVFSSFILIYSVSFISVYRIYCGTSQQQ